jgi:hypothetical protein
MLGNPYQYPFDIHELVVQDHDANYSFLTEPGNTITQPVFWTGPTADICRPPGWPWAREDGSGCWTAATATPSSPPPAWPPMGMSPPRAGSGRPGTSARPARPACAPLRAGSSGGGGGAVSSGSPNLQALIDFPGAGRNARPVTPMACQSHTCQQVSWPTGGQLP